MQSYDSMEGISASTPEPRTGDRSLLFDWQKYLNLKFEKAGILLPGVTLAILLAFAGTYAANWMGLAVFGLERSPISPILATVVLGLAIRNLIGLPVAFEDGLRFCIKNVLRIGVALLGLRLSLTAVGQIGLEALPVVLGCIIAALLMGNWLSKLLGLPEGLGSLIAVGTSICGVSAIVATAPAINADDDEISYAVAVITLFGMVALFCYPVLAFWIFSGDPRLAGFFLGSAIHDTSQVAGAGLMYQTRYDAPVGLDVATTTKLVRNLFLGVVIPMIAIIHHRKSSFGGKSVAGRRLHWHQWIPFFVIAFIGLAAVRTVGDFGVTKLDWVNPDVWNSVLGFAMQISVFCLTIAMASIGLGTYLGQFKKLGWKPLAVGFAVAVTVGFISVILIQLINTIT